MKNIFDVGTAKTERGRCEVANFAQQIKKDYECIKAKALKNIFDLGTAKAERGAKLQTSHNSLQTSHNSLRVTDVTQKSEGLKLL